MAAELPPVANIIETAYRFHFFSRTAIKRSGKLATATEEFRAAIKVRPGIQETAAALKNAEAQAAQRASTGEWQSRRWLTVVTMPRKMISSPHMTCWPTCPTSSDIGGSTDQLEALKKDYAPAAARRAMKLQEIQFADPGAAPMKKLCGRHMN